MQTPSKGRDPVWDGAMNDSEQKPMTQTPVVDVAALLAEIEQKVAEKKAAGVYDPAEVRRVEEEALSFSKAEQDASAAELAYRAAKLQELWDTSQCGVTTHRAGLKGRLVSGTKRLLHRITKPYVNLVMARQVLFNSEVIKLLSALSANYSDLRYALGSELAETKRSAEARLSALEREAGKGHAQVENVLAGLQRTLEGQAAAGPEALAALDKAKQTARGAAYLAFEDLHRGESQEIKERLHGHLELFAGAVSDDAPLLDVGCGRGEFLELCAEASLPAKGVDLNPEMVAHCSELGLQAEVGEALAYVGSLADQSLGGIMLSQIIEHLKADDLVELVSACAAKLKPGGVLLAETINPQCLSTFASAFYLDLTHNKPIHPEAARFLWRWAGLGDVRIIHSSRMPPESRLEQYQGPGEGEMTMAFNRNVTRLNQLLFSYQEYAVVGRK